MHPGSSPCPGRAKQAKCDSGEKLPFHCTAGIKISLFEQEVNIAVRQVSLLTPPPLNVFVSPRITPHEHFTPALTKFLNQSTFSKCMCMLVFTLYCSTKTSPCLFDSFAPDLQENETQKPSILGQFTFKPPKKYPKSIPWR